MEKLKKHLAIILLAMVVVVFVGCTQKQETVSQNEVAKETEKTEKSEETKKSEEKNKVIKIGITQIVEHPALDSARDGFIKALEENGYTDGKNIELDYQNAQGDMTIAQTIGKNFVAQDKDLIFAVATPTAQAAYNATEKAKKDIPILITAVTDAVAAGIVKSNEKPETNVSGTSDATPIKEQLTLLKQLVPDAKTVGTIYTTSEVNSEIQVNQLKEIAPEFGLEVVVKGFSNINEIGQTLDSMINDIDVLYIPTDNNAASSIPTLLGKTLKKSIPIIGGERGQVDNGALATEGIDYYELGYQTGLMAIKVIEGEDVSQMAVETLKNTKLVINKSTADKLGLEISKELLDQAEIVE